METNDQGRRGHGPYAVAASHHGILAAAHLYFDLLRIWRLKLENGTLVRQHARVLGTIYIRRGWRSILDSRGLYTFRGAAPRKVSIQRFTESRII